MFTWSIRCTNNNVNMLLNKLFCVCFRDVYLFITMSVSDRCLSLAQVVECKLRGHNRGGEIPNGV